MYSLLLVIFAAAAVSLLLTPLCRAASHACGLLDKPDFTRKVHSIPTPRIGGFPIVVAYLAAYAVLGFSHLRGVAVLHENIVLARAVLPAAALIFLVGLIDDIFTLRPWQKFAGQILAALLAFHSGVQFTTLAGHAFPVWLDLPITVIWLVGCCNAFNLIDGVDGLAAGVGLFATITMLIAALLQHNMGLALATAPLAAALLGFLPYNFNPASIFLGDCGSLVIGFLLGSYGILWSHKSTTILGLTAPLMALSIPLLETGLSILRRALARKPIFGADRGHIHHRLLDRGFTPRHVALLLYAVCGLSAAFSLVCSFQERIAGPIVVLFAAVTWAGIHSLGYAEFADLRDKFRSKSTREHRKGAAA